MTRALVLLAALLLAAPAGAQPEPGANRRAIAIVPTDGGEIRIVAVVVNSGLCKQLVQRLNIGAAAPPEDDFRFACVAVPVEV